MKRLTTVLAVALAIILATDSTIDASIIIKKDLRQLATECDRIVVGRVLSQRCSWVGGKVIYTHTTVQVSRTLKGKADKTIVISEPGGRIGDTICVVPGVPGYQVKERVLVMVKKDALGLDRTYGLVQGKFQMLRNLSSDEMFVLPPKGMKHIVRGHFTPEEISPRGSIEIEDFENRVTRLIATAKKKGDRK